MSKMLKRQQSIDSGSDIEGSEDFDLDELQAMEDMEIDDPQPLFWSMKLVPDQEQLIQEPHIPGYMIHITNACFGPQINKDTRTLVMIETSEDDEAAALCVLSARNENVVLDIMINGMFDELSLFSVQG